MEFRSGFNRRTNCCASSKQKRRGKPSLRRIRSEVQCLSQPLSAKMEILLRETRHALTFQLQWIETDEPNSYLETKCPGLTYGGTSHRV